MNRSRAAATLELGVVAIIVELLASFLAKWRRARYRGVTFVRSRARLFVDGVALARVKPFSLSDVELYESVIAGDPKLRQLIRDRVDEITDAGDLVVDEGGDLVPTEMKP